MKKIIDVKDPADFSAWVNGALAGYVHENGQNKDGVMQVDADKILGVLAARVVQMLLLVKEYHPENLEETMGRFLGFIAVNMRQGFSVEPAPGDDDPDRRSLQ
jgi:hypothetical protein